MKKKNKKVSLLAAVLAASIIVGCASGPQGDAPPAPVLGQPNLLQQALNILPAVPIAGRNLKFQFGGDTWIAKADGKNYMAGTFQSEDNDGGSTLTLKQTHTYSTEKKPGIGGDVGWVKTPGPQIVLEYKAGPPGSLSPK